MGNHNNNRFQNIDECNEYLVSKGIDMIKCLKYGGTFKAKSKFKCLKDNYEWETTLDALSNSRSKTGCPKCGNVARIKNIEEVNEWLLNNRPTIQCLEYGGTTTSPSLFRCLIDGYEWRTRFSNIKSGKGCPVCGNVKKIKTIDEVNEWLIENKKKIVCLSYIGNVRQKSWFHCECCHHSWETSYNAIRSGNGCPNCNLSKGEKRIQEILDENEIMYKAQFYFSDCVYEAPLKYDFAIFNKNKLYALCEYQGIQHYEPVDFASKGAEWANSMFELNQKRDNIKRDYCKNNNLKLIEIPYWDFGEIDNIITDLIRNMQGDDLSARTQ
jgi:hypothetical protein